MIKQYGHHARTMKQALVKMKRDISILSINHRLKNGVRENGTNELPLTGPQTRNKKAVAATQNEPTRGWLSPKAEQT